MKIVPLYNNIIVKPNPLDLKTEGGIIIQETGTRAVNMQTGTVVAVGCGMITPDGTLMPLQVKVGDTVLYLRGTGIQIKYNLQSEELYAFKETDLYGILIDDTVEQILREASTSLL